MIIQSDHLQLHKDDEPAAWLPRHLCQSRAESACLRWQSGLVMQFRSHLMGEVHLGSFRCLWAAMHMTLSTVLHPVRTTLHPSTLALHHTAVATLQDRSGLARTCCTLLSTLGGLDCLLGWIA